jgi:hypothetical protein
VRFISNPRDYTFDIIIEANSKFEQILRADSIAQAAAGVDNFNDTYFNTLWQETKSLTGERLQKASEALANLYYTAWINAGQPVIPTVVPVELVDFNASVTNNYVLLNWATASEKNNYGFMVERRKSDSEQSRWERVGFVSGHGTTAFPNTYQYEDRTLQREGTFSYRLKQMDTDGSFTYSSEVEVDYDPAPNGFVLHQNYPNPFNPRTTILYEIPEDGHVTLNVYDMLGKNVAHLVSEYQSAGVYHVIFDASQLASGMYLYRFQVLQEMKVSRRKRREVAVFSETKTMEVVK